jgi:hypothetical protein
VGDRTFSKTLFFISSLHNDYITKLLVLHTPEFPHPLLLLLHQETQVWNPLSWSLLVLPEWANNFILHTNILRGALIFQLCRDVFKPLWPEHRILVGYGVLIPVTIRITVFWDVTPCSHVEIQRRFGGKPRLYLPSRRVSQARQQQAAGGNQLLVSCFSETSLDGLHVTSQKILLFIQYQLQSCLLTKLQSTYIIDADDSWL